MSNLFSPCFHYLIYFYLTLPIYFHLDHFFKKQHWMLMKLHQIDLNDQQRLTACLLNWHYQINKK